MNVNKQHQNIMIFRYSLIGCSFSSQLFTYLSLINWDVELFFLGPRRNWGAGGMKQRFIVAWFQVKKILSPVLNIKSS